MTQFKGYLQMIIGVVQPILNQLGPFSKWRLPERLDSYDPICGIFHWRHVPALATSKEICWLGWGRLEVLSSLLLPTRVLAFVGKSFYALTSCTQWHRIGQGGVWTWVDFQKGPYSALFNGCEDAIRVYFAKPSRVFSFFPGDELLYFSGWLLSLDFLDFFVFDFNLLIFS